MTHSARLNQLWSMYSAPSLLFMCAPYPKHPNQWKCTVNDYTRLLNAPDVNGGRVFGEKGAAKLRGSVPSCGHVVCPKDGCWLVIQGCRAQGKHTYIQDCKQHTHTS